MTIGATTIIVEYKTTIVVVKTGTTILVEHCPKPSARRWNMKVFVTGATGYIGGSVAERLIASGHQVVGLVRSAEKAPLLKDRGIEPVLGNSG